MTSYRKKKTQKTTHHRHNKFKIAKESQADHALSARPLKGIKSLKCAAIAHDLLLNLPLSIEEAMNRSGRWSLCSIRHALVQLIELNGLSIEEGDQLSPLFKVIGVTGVEVDLERLVKSALAQKQREQAFAAIFHSEAGAELFETFSANDRIELSGPWVRPMMRMAPLDLFPRYALAALYQSTDSVDRPLIIDFFERSRSMVKASPQVVYERLFSVLESASEIDALLAILSEKGELSSLDFSRSYISIYVRDRAERCFGLKEKSAS